VSRELKQVVLALGSNLGDRGDILRGAVEAIAGLPGVAVRAVSPVYETAHVGGPVQPDYLNAAVLAQTTLAPPDLLDAVHEVEAAFSRVREVRWGPRTLDIDIIAYEGVLSDDPDLTLPHPRAHERAFVLAPWHDADPGAVLPGHGPVSDLLKQIPEDQAFRKSTITLPLGGTTPRTPRCESDRALPRGGTTPQAPRCESDRKNRDLIGPARDLIGPADLYRGGTSDSH
jgi:2-amino-4-hydroxy-6-hydroxymethyldihydropteridine diphosphokinase